MSNFWKGLVIRDGIHLGEKTERLIYCLLLMILLYLAIVLFLGVIEPLISLSLGLLSFIPVAFIVSFLLWVVGGFILLFTFIILTEDLPEAIIIYRQKVTVYQKSIHWLKNLLLSIIGSTMAVVFCWGIVLYLNSLALGWVVALLGTSLFLLVGAVRSSG